jgi:S-adenosylmethionine:tRNA ribosyltransferase-isomerase
MPAGHIPDDAWDYSLPSHCIARRPSARRDGSRLIHVPLGEETVHDRMVEDLVHLLQPGDLLVGNNTRVMACRLRARRKTGGAVELLVLEPGPGPVAALARPAKKVRAGDVLTLPDGSKITILTSATDGVIRISFDEPVPDILDRHGEIPLPPYLGRRAEPEDTDRYQTVYAGPLGAAAAPTAGLHFTPNLFGQFKERGIGWAEVTLHVGLGTFRPLRPEDLERGVLHPERYDIPAETAEAIRMTRHQGGRVVAVGTTTVRALEAGTPQGSTDVVAGTGVTTLFLRPPDRLRSVDGLVTNLHLPKSSLLMLVACLVGRERLLQSYAHAVSNGYRFYSYGDAMLLL